MTEQRRIGRFYGIAGVIVIMVNTFSKPETETEQPPETQLVENEGVNSVVGEPVEPTTTPEPEPESEPEIIISKAEKVSIYYGTREKTDVTMKVSETLQFKAVTVPAEIESAPPMKFSLPVTAERDQIETGSVSPAWRRGIRVNETRAEIVIVYSLGCCVSCWL